MHRLQKKKYQLPKRHKKLSKHLTTEIYGADKFQERIGTKYRREINPTKKSNQTPCFKGRDWSWGAIEKSFVPLRP